MSPRTPSGSTRRPARHASIPDSTFPIRDSRWRRFRFLELGISNPEFLTGLRPKAALGPARESKALHPAIPRGRCPRGASLDDPSSKRSRELLKGFRRSRTSAAGRHDSVLPNRGRSESGVRGRPRKFVFASQPAHFLIGQRPWLMEPAGAERICPAPPVLPC
jgi:hypothetical protein